MPNTSDPLPLPPLSCRQRPPAGFSRSSVKVVTNDGEWFPVKRVLLRPCIALTTALRAEQAGLSEAEVPVDVDTLTFDRRVVLALVPTKGTSGCVLNINGDRADKWQAKPHVGGRSLLAASCKRNLNFSNL